MKNSSIEFDRYEDRPRVNICVFVYIALFIY